MMRIAVAGGGGLGHLLATTLSQAENSYNVIVLSRSPRPEYAVHDIQVHPVNYYQQESLSYALQGVDLVISTVSGPEQLNLIVAAGDGRVRYFVPAEFEGSLRHRPKHDPLDRGSKQALDLLKHLEEKKRLKYTIFCCGVLMETFLPYGLGSLGIGYGAGVAHPGSFLLDINNATAEYSERDAKKNSVRVCLTSVYDLARFIVAAIDLGPKNWPNELSLRGDRLTTRDIVSQCSLARSVVFTQDVRQHADLDLYHKHYLTTQEYGRAAYYQRLIATADGRFDFSNAKLNDIVDHSPSVSVRPLTFAQWLASIFELSP